MVHHPQDARIRRRQIAALLEAGWEVSYAAPWRAYGVTPDPAVKPIELPRAQGRRRVRALRAAVRVLRRCGEHDLVLLHDPELLLAELLARPRVPVVLDVHEDTAAALVDRPWLPGWLRGMGGWSIRRLERLAERRVRLLLAEDAYAERFEGSHPVVPNVPPVATDRAPAASPARAIYLGRISAHRGAHELLAVGARLAGSGVVLDLVGPADADVVEDVRAAAAAGTVRWHGFVPNRQALDLVDGAVAGLSLLHDLPNYRVSAPTKVYEYLARGVPVVTTPLPLPARLVTEHDVGVVVPFGDAPAAAAAVGALAADPRRRETLGRRAHELARERFDWGREGPRFADQLAVWARRAGAPRADGRER